MAPGAPAPADASGARLGVLPVIIAAVAAWLLMADLHLRAFSSPGRLAIFVAIFAAVRWLMRRLWHVGRGGCHMGCSRYPGRR